MNRIECEFEADVLSTPRPDPELRHHIAGCRICRDAALVSSALAAESEATRPEPHQIPDSGRIWWHAQLRARREAVKDAGRPITAAQVLIFAAAMGLLGACFGATSAWFQTALAWLRTSLGEVAWQHYLPSTTALVGIVTLLLVIPVALYLARDPD